MRAGAGLARWDIPVLRTAPWLRAAKTTNGSHACFSDWGWFPWVFHELLPARATEPDCHLQPLLAAPPATATCQGRSCAAHGAGGSSSPHLRPGAGGCFQQWHRGWGGTWPCHSSVPSLCPCSAVPSMQRSRSPASAAADGAGNPTAGGGNGHKSKSALPNAPAGSEPNLPPRGGTPGTVVTSRGPAAAVNGVGPR